MITPVRTKYVALLAALVGLLGIFGLTGLTSDAHAQQEPTTLTTSLSGEGKSGPVITVKEEAEVTDSATLGGVNPSTASGLVEYRVYSDIQCKTLVAEAGAVNMVLGSIPPSNPEKLPPGTYYWQAAYSGDEDHQAAKSLCGSEVETVKNETCGKKTIGKFPDQLVANQKRVNRCTVPFPALIKELVMYLAPTSHSGSQTIKGVIYEDSSGKPGKLLATSVQFTFSSKDPAGWYKLVFPGLGVAVPAGSYWIGVLTGATSQVAGERFDSVSNAEDFNSNTYTSGPSDPFGPLKTTNEEMSLYAKFTEIGL